MMTFTKEQLRAHLVPLGDDELWDDDTVPDLAAFALAQMERAEKAEADLSASESASRMYADRTLRAEERQREEAIRLLAWEGEAEAERDEAIRFIEHAGYRRCDIPACNCGSWHGGNAMARLGEIRDALESADVDTNGLTILGAVEGVLSERDRLAKELEEAEDGIRKLLSAYSPDGHSVPYDCFSTGPLTGDPYVDLVVCPACVAHAHPAVRRVRERKEAPR